CLSSVCFVLCAASSTAFYALSLHDALPICSRRAHDRCRARRRALPGLRPADPLGGAGPGGVLSAHGRRLPQLLGGARGAEDDARSEEHTSELQSHLNLVCRLLLEKKKHNNG